MKQGTRTGNTASKAEYTGPVAAVLEIQELIALIASYLRSADLARATRINRRFRTLFDDRAFWRNQIRQYGYSRAIGADKSAAELRHRYRIVENIAGRTREFHSENYFSNSMYCIQDLNDVILLFRDEGNSMSVYKSGAQIHRYKPLFEPLHTLQGGQLCIGWEGEELVIRDIKDWSLAARLATQDREWIVGDIEHDGLLCLQRGEKAGIIERWDNWAQEKSGEMVHMGCSDWIIFDNQSLATASRDGLIKVWDLESCNLRYKFELPTFESFRCA